jgi:hydrogenase nickel incorporation protein HypA/HybF
MHEYALVEALVRRVEEEARRRSALAVHALRVSVGELSGVDPELLSTAYYTFREGTACAAAELTLRRVPAAWRCPRCGAPVAAGAALRCAPCDAPAELAPGGDALLLEAIDLEVP